MGDDGGNVLVIGRRFIVMHRRARNTVQVCRGQCFRKLRV